MDCNLSAVIEGKQTISEASDELLEKVVRIINGEMTKAEAYGFSDIAVDHVCRFV